MSVEGEWVREFPPIWHDDGSVTLWHPDSPGGRLRLRPSWWRRWVAPGSPFATLGEVGRYYKRSHR